MKTINHLKMKAKEYCTGAKNNDMAINLDKTKCMTVGSWQCIARLERKLHFEIHGKETENVKYAKLLVVIIDYRLSWD